MGETILIPTCIKSIKITSNNALELLEVKRNKENQYLLY